MKREPASKPFPTGSEEVAGAITQAPDRVQDPDSPYDPNDAAAVKAFWKGAAVRPPGQRGPGKKTHK